LIEAFWQNAEMGKIKNKMKATLPINPRIWIFCFIEFIKNLNIGMPNVKVQMSNQWQMTQCQENLLGNLDFGFHLKFGLWNLTFLYLFFKKGGSKGTISRVLSSWSGFPAGIRRMAIYLGPWLPRVSSDLTRPAVCSVKRNKLEWAFSSPLWNRRSRRFHGGSGTYLVLLRVGFT